MGYADYGDCKREMVWVRTDIERQKERIKELEKKVEVLESKTQELLKLLKEAE